MKTTSLYHGFALQHEEVSKEIVKRVTAATPVQRLFLLGLTTAYRRTETLFSLQSATRKEVTHYFLLALAEKEVEHSLNSVQDKIEGALQPYLPVTAIVFSAVQFSRWLLEGHPFAAAVYEKAFLLYQKDEMPLPVPAIPNEEVIKKEAEQLYTQTKTRVQEFIAGAELYTIRVQYKMAAFMLHQAAEQALRTMLIMHTGLRINTHSMDKLIRYCSMFCFELQDVFPRRNEKEKRVFQLLQKAYIDTRYKEDYCLQPDDILTITKQVKRLYEIFQQSSSFSFQ
ncbi:MAG TPA: HEPN domain-containing protein [Flavisolibacter sp.]|jgi:HEPN domain-containing protein|nr:HEPN domain-containing protein [Flavisolibacter sp.]